MGPSTVGGPQAPLAASLDRRRPTRSPTTGRKANGVSPAFRARSALGGPHPSSTRATRRSRSPAIRPPPGTHGHTSASFAFNASEPTSPRPATGLPSPKAATGQPAREAPAPTLAYRGKLFASQPHPRPVPGPTTRRTTRARPTFQWTVTAVSRLHAASQSTAQSSPAREPGFVPERRKDQGRTTPTFTGKPRPAGEKRGTLLAGRPLPARPPRARRAREDFTGWVDGSVGRQPGATRLLNHSPQKPTGTRPAAVSPALWASLGHRCRPRPAPRAVAFHSTPPPASNNGLHSRVPPQNVGTKFSLRQRLRPSPYKSPLGERWGTKPKKSDRTGFYSRFRLLGPLLARDSNDRSLEGQRRGEGKKTRQGIVPVDRWNRGQSPPPRRRPPPSTPERSRRSDKPPGYVGKGEGINRGEKPPTFTRPRRRAGFPGGRRIVVRSNCS